MDYANFHMQVVGLRWHFFAEMGGPRGTFLRILHRSSFQNYASHPGRGALFPKSEKNYAEKGVLSNTSRNGTADGTRNTHNAQTTQHIQNAQNMQISKIDFLHEVPESKVVDVV